MKVYQINSYRHIYETALKYGHENDRRSFNCNLSCCNSLSVNSFPGLVGENCQNKQIQHL